MTKEKSSFNGRFDMLSSIQLETNHPGGLIIEGRIDKKTKFDYSLNFWEYLIDEKKKVWFHFEIFWSI